MKQGCKVDELPSQEIIAVLIAVAEKVLSKISVKRRRRARKVL